MAEINNNFLRSKMNKDLDNRLVPNGEYRNAIGINISQSEGPNVGALEVVPGNQEVFSLADDMRFIGRFDDEINNTIYFFATDHSGSSEAPASSTHQIIKWTQGAAVPEILVDGYFLNFSQDSIITGVSTLETQLFFTDNRNQPRVIDVTKPFGYYTKEEHVSVAKFAPYESISVLQSRTETVVSFSAPSGILLSSVGGVSDDDRVKVGDIVYNVTQNAEYGHVQAVNYATNTITSDKDLTSAAQQAPSYGVAKPPVSSDVIRISRSTMSDESDDPNWPGDPDFLEDKFARFSYRFKYDNNEYSLVAPWTQPIFIPKQFGFFAEKTYGVSALVSDPENEQNAFRSTILNWFDNRVNQVGLYIPFPSNEPVIDYKIKEIEVLYKKSDSVQQQVLERVPINQVVFDAYKPEKNYYKYIYQSRKPYRTLPESVTTRVSDKVPVRALSQEIISNRVVYGNFDDRWDPPAIEYTTQSGPRSSEFSDDVAEYPNHTLKQNRNYTIGVVLYDKYGRASSVITSNIPDVPGDKISTLYHKYKTEGDVGYGGFTGVYKVYDWLGDSLRINFQNPIPEFPVNNYPGVYAEGTIFTLDSPNTTTITTTAPFTYTIAGGDFTTQMPVNNYLRGYHVDYTKIISSTFAGGNTIVVTEKQIANIYGYTGGYPGLGTEEPKRAYKINPAGWYSFRIVVQQQEQDYYNVYLPGLTNGFPWDGNELVPTLTSSYPLNELFPQSVNRILTTSLISDNINKIPRDLSEVGPDQEQYRSSSTKLFLRVKNTDKLFDITRLATGSGYSDGTDISTTGGSGTGLTVNITTIAGGAVDTVGIYELGYGYQDGDIITISGGSGTATAELTSEDKRNQLYFPGRTDHYVAQIGKQQELLDAAGDGGATTDLSKYIPFDGYYSSESNPFVAVIELNNTDPTDLGVTYQQWFSTRPTLPRLAVYETEPFESVLDIYWETSTNGLISDLNDLVLTTFDGVFGLTEFSTNFRESIDYASAPQAVTDVFYAIDSTGGNASGFVIDIIEVTDGDGTIIQTQSTPAADKTFTIQQTTFPSGDELEIFCQKNFTYRDTSAAVDVYTVKMQFTLSGETTVQERVIPLQNDTPFFQLTGVTSGTDIYDILDTDKDVSPVVALYNGSEPDSDPTAENKIVQLNFEIVDEQRVAPGATIDTNIFTVDPITFDSATQNGQSYLRVNETLTTPGEQYTMTLRATDASQGVGFLVYEKTIAVNIGFGPKFSPGTGTSVESVALQSGTWGCNQPGNINGPLRSFGIYDGFFVGDAPSGCTFGCNNPTTGTPFYGYYTKSYTGLNPYDSSIIWGSYNIENINSNLTDLQAEVISSIVNPGTGYTPGTQLNVTGGSGLNMTVNITSVNASNGITGVEIANSGTLAPPYGTGPTGYVNGDIVTVIQAGSGNNAELELDGSLTSNAFVVAYEVITPNVVPGGNNYQFSPLGTATKQAFEIIHKYKSENNGCASSGGSLSNFGADFASGGDPTKGFLTFSAPTGFSTAKTITHAITNIFQQSEKNASTQDNIAASPSGGCSYIDPILGDKTIAQGTIYFRVKLKAYDPLNKVFGTTAVPGTLTGWDYWDNNKVLAEDVIGMVFSDMPSSWTSQSCRIGLNDPRWSLSGGTCGTRLNCP